MTVADLNKVDMITLNDDEAVMIITDHLPWGEGSQDKEHMFLI